MDIDEEETLISMIKDKGKRTTLPKSGYRIANVNHNRKWGVQFINRMTSLCLLFRVILMYRYGVVEENKRG